MTPMTPRILLTLCLLLASLLPSSLRAEGAGPGPATLRLFVWQKTPSGPERTAIPFTPAGRDRLEQIFADHFACGGGHGEAGRVVQCLESMRQAVPAAVPPLLVQEAGKQASLTYRLATRLVTDPQARRDLATIGGWGRSRVVDVHLRLADAAEELGVGSRLKVDDGEGTRHDLELDGTKTLDEIAAEYHTTRDAILALNFTTVEVWPHCQAGACTEQVHGRPQVVAELRLGEKALEDSDRSFDDAWGTMLHEAAHASDDSPAPEANYRYGRDGTHYLTEILSPAAAFTEGWAEFVPATLAPENTGYIITGVVSPEAPTSFLIEQDVEPGAEGAGYDEHERASLSASQLLANERVVSRVLYKTKDAVGGLEPMGQAFRSTNSLRGRHIASYMSQLARQVLEPGEWGNARHPELWGAALRGMIRALVDEAGLTPELAWRLLRSGELPDGRAAGAAPGPVALPVVVTPPPPEEGSGGSSGGGILGMD